MCGRYDLNDSPQMLMLYFMLDLMAAPYSNADVRPTNTARSSVSMRANGWPCRHAGD